MTTKPSDSSSPMNDTAKRADGRSTEVVVGDGSTPQDMAFAIALHASAASRSLAASPPRVTDAAENLRKVREISAYARDKGQHGGQPKSASSANEGDLDPRENEGKGDAS